MKFSWFRSYWWSLPFFLFVPIALIFLLWINRYSGNHVIELIGEDGQFAVLSIHIPYHLFSSFDWEEGEWWDDRDVIVKTIKSKDWSGDIELKWFLMEEMEMIIFGKPQESNFWIAGGNYFSLTYDFSSGEGEWSMGDDSPWTGLVKEFHN
jgi:hypothetical protein